MRLPDRRVWRTSTTIASRLVLDAIGHAIWTPRREGVEDLSGLIHHHDRGSHPLHGFDQNRIWLAVMQLACELVTWTRMLALREPPAP